MLTRTGALLIAAVWCAGMVGCVSADVYRLKEQEALDLSRTNQEMQERNKSLRAEKTELQARSGELTKEKEELQARVEKLNGAIVFLQNRAEKLEKDGEGLRGQVENLNAKIADLNKENQKLALLTRPENLLRTLGERLGELQKQVDTLAGENQKLKSRQVVARSDEEKTAGAEAEKTIGSTDEKPKAVRVSVGQKAEEIAPIAPRQQVQEELKQPAVSDSRQ